MTTPAKVLMLGTRTVLMLSCMFLSGCGGSWEGFVYPDKEDLSTHIGIGSYSSLDECRVSALASLRQISSPERGDYECGYKCSSRSDLGGLKVCETTER